ncbi:MAG TPA: mechanosensitive ion channel family protein [Rhodanobacteraceae bacterium]
MDSWFQHADFLGNSVYAWVAAGIGALVGYIVVFTLVRFVGARLASVATRHPHAMPISLMAIVLRATRGWLLLLLAIVMALHSLHFGADIDARLYWLLGKKGTTNGLIGWLALVLFTIQIGFWLSALIVGWLKRATPEGSMQKSNPVIYGLLTWFVQLMVWVTLLLVLLSSANVPIGTFITSLGIGGIAVAMAAKNVLEDLFASIAIGLDKPFEVGDYIGFGTDQGTVRKVGIKSTRIQSLDGEEMAISNATLLRQLVYNYSRRRERRVLFDFYVPLDTPRERLGRIAATVNSLIEGEAATRLDRGHFMEISRDGFRFEFVYYVLSPAFSTYADLQQSINLRIIDALADLDVSFALPTHIVRTPDAAR